MLSQNKNYNSIGKVSCLLLLLLTLLAINPVSSSAYAEEGSNSERTTNLAASETDDAGISPQSVLTTSSVSFSFGNPVGVTSLTPTTTSGASAKYSVKATVDVTNSGGYTVYIGSNKSELTGKNTGTTINSVTSSTTYEEMPVNSWGYSYTEGETAGTTFSAMPANVRGVVLGSNNSTEIKADRKIFTLSFAAHIGNDKPADTYENTITMSVVSSPLEVVFSGIDNLQDMTSSICSTATIGDTKQLKDIRDGKYYWVTKLADNNCWMTQNLDLDLSTSVALTPATSDVTSNWTPGFDTATQATADTVNPNSHTETRSWSLGDYRITNPTVASACGSSKNDLSQCPEQFTPYATPITPNGDELAHYIVGNHYQWNAATAGTGGTITSGEASGSICPKGWKLPASDAATSGSFGGLIEAGDIRTDVVKLTSVPYYFVRGGGINPDTALLLYNVGVEGGYWSSTPTSNSVIAYGLILTSDATITPAFDYSRQNGFAVRCVAR